MNEKKFITKEQAVYILPDGNLIHTFYQLGSSLVGADWSREEIIEKIQKSVILELTGEIAKGMGHGLVAYDKDAERQSQILFIETNAERLEEVENGRNKESVSTIQYANYGETRKSRTHPAMWRKHASWV